MLFESPSQRAYIVSHALPLLHIVQRLARSVLIFLLPLLRLRVWLLRFGFLSSCRGRTSGAATAATSTATRLGACLFLLPLFLHGACAEPHAQREQPIHSTSMLLVKRVHSFLIAEAITDSYGVSVFGCVWVCVGVWLSTRVLVWCQTSLHQRKKDDNRITSPQVAVAWTH